MPDRIAKIITATGMGLWLGSLAALTMVSQCLYFLTLPMGTYFHAGATEFSLLIESVLTALVVLPFCVYDLIKRRFWGLVGIAVALSVYPVDTAILSLVFHLKRFRSEY